MPSKPKVTVTGIDGVRKMLTKVDKTIASELTKELRGVGNEMRDKARGLLPSSAPLSNWQGSGRAMPSRLPYWEGTGPARKGIKTVVGEGSRQRGTYSKGAVVRVRSDNPAAAVFDKVGDGGSTFVQNLNRKHGSKRRALLKAYDGSKDAARRKVEKAVLDAVQRVTKGG
jgi:hypothetical protein